jgi:hypothetical protein
MNPNEYKFEHYLEQLSIFNMHSNKINIYKHIPNKIEKMPNIIIHGPNGIGRYSQALYIAAMFSPSRLKYEKRIAIDLNDTQYIYKISDVHIDIDLSLLGCNPKGLWHAIYYHLIEIVKAGTSKSFIMLCKNFSTIPGELLELFYSYMHMHVHIKFIFITDAVCCLPDNLIKSCFLIQYSRPTTTSYKKINIHLENNTTISNIRNNLHRNNADKISMVIVEHMTQNIKNYTTIRKILYDILIYNFDLDEILWQIINCKKCIDEDTDKFIKLIVQVIYFYKYYNNNYRPIYHLEKILYGIITIYGL